MVPNNPGLFLAEDVLSRKVSNPAAAMMLANIMRLRDRENSPQALAPSVRATVKANMVASMRPDIFIARLVTDPLKISFFGILLLAVSLTDEYTAFSVIGM